MSTDDLHELLSDPSVWVEPDPSLEDRVMAAVAAEVAATGSAHWRGRRRSTTTDMPRSRSRRSRLALVVAGAAAAVAAAVLSIGALTGNGGGSPRFTAALAPVGGTPSATTASASATLTRTATGWHVYLQVEGLPRLDHGHFYEAWLGNGSGGPVAIGTFNQGEDVTLWSGVSPQDYPMVTITAEDADGNPAPSGRSVLTGVASRVR
jgi:hypothetical protein